jgi:hypothetical protein
MALLHRLLHLRSTRCRFGRPIALSTSPLCTHSAAQCTPFAEFPVMCHSPCTSAPMVPRTLSADGVGERRRMELRPCAIGETGGYLAVADHPRPPVGAEQSAPKSLARSRLALRWAPSERSTGTHPPVGAGAAAASLTVAAGQAAELGDAWSVER